jgi:hypothetical protein
MVASCTASDVDRWGNPLPPYEWSRKQAKLSHLWTETATWNVRACTRLHRKLVCVVSQLHCVANNVRQNLRGYTTVGLPTNWRHLTRRKRRRIGIGITIRIGIGIGIRIRIRIGIRIRIRIRIRNFVSTRQSSVPEQSWVRKCPERQVCWSLEWKGRITSVDPTKSRLLTTGIFFLCVGTYKTSRLRRENSRFTLTARDN